MSMNIVIFIAIGVALLGAALHFVKATKGRAAQVLQAVNPGGVNYIDGHEVHSVSPGTMKLSRAQRRRRAASIAAYVGFNGSAKTATMIWDTLPDLAAGRKVLSTVALLSSRPAETLEEAAKAWDDLGVPELRPHLKPYALPHPLWIPFTDFRQLLEATDCVVLMDEVQGIADSRDSMGLPVQVRNKLFQLRRNDVVLRWTTLDWSTADRRIRYATQILTYCRGFWPKFEPGKVWATKRLFWLRTYDARGFDDFTEARNRVSDERRPRPIIREWVRLFGGLKPAIETYDTLAAVLSLGASSDAGLCMTCGGARKRRSCDCADHKNPVRGKGRRAVSPAGGADAEQTEEPCPSGSLTGNAEPAGGLSHGFEHLPAYIG